jgi:hypothetical protein
MIDETSAEAGGRVIPTHHGGNTSRNGARSRFPVETLAVPPGAWHVERVEEAVRERIVGGL